MTTKNRNQVLHVNIPIKIVLKLTCLIAIVFSFISSYSYAESVRVGYFITSPHVIIEPETNKLTGACVELFEKYIAPEMGITVEWAKNATSIPRQLFQLDEHKLDVGLVFAKNSEREKILNYPQKPFLVSKPTLAFLKEHPIKTIEKPEDISGLLVGYGTKAYISPFMRYRIITFDLVTTPDWMDLNLKKLLAGRNDAMYQPERSSFLYYLRKQNLEDRIKLISLPETVQLYTTFSKKSDKSLPERYDRAFEKINGAELYIKILSKYLDVSRL